jgi:hypothetical protein
LNTLLDYFDVITYNRLMSYVSALPALMAEKSSEKQALKGLVEFDALVVSVDKAYDVVKKIFASDKKSEIISNITNLGFSEFVQNGTIQKIDDLQGDKYDLIVNLLSRTLDIPAENKQDFLDQMTIAQFSSDDKWTNFRNVFSKDQSGNCKSINIMVTRNEEKNTFSFLIADIKQSFVLAPDIIAYRNSKSTFGGLFTSQTDDIKQIPHRLTTDDMKTLLDFFDVITIEKFKQYFVAKAAVKALNYEFLDL